MPRILRTNAATEDLVGIFTAAAIRSPRFLERRRAEFECIFGLLESFLRNFDPI